VLLRAGPPVKVEPVEVPVVVVEEDTCGDPFPGCSKLKRDACKKCSMCQFMSACGCIPKQCACGDAKCIKNADSGDKVTICHATGSASNPYVEITISKSAVQAHENHAGDIIPAPSTGCPMTVSM
jgi:hypothetical protein